MQIKPYKFVRLFFAFFLFRNKLNEEKKADAYTLCSLTLKVSFESI